MALFEKLSASSSPQEIAEAYAEFTGMAGGDNPANQKLAIDYLSNLGVATPSINQAYNLYTTPTTVVSGLPTATDTNVTTTGGGLSNLTTGTTSNLGSTTGATTGVTTGATTGLTNLTPTGLSTVTDLLPDKTDTTRLPPTTATRVDETGTVIDLGNGTYRLINGDIIDSNGYPVTSTGGLSTLNNITTAPADNITSTGYTKPTSGLTGVSGQKVIEGDDIETQIAQLPTEYASWQTSSVPGYIDFIRKDDGAVLDRRQNNTFSDLDLLKIGLSFIPGAGTILAVINTADAVRSGNLLQAAIGATGLLPGMANVNTGLRVGQAVNSGNTFGALTALAGNTDLQNYFGTNNLTIGGYTAKDAISAANLYTASQNGNYAGIIANAGALINSPDTVLAGKALAVLQAAESGNPNALNMAVSAFNSVGGGGGLPTTTGTTTVADSVPLTDEEIADLTPEQLRVYQEGGVAGLRDYNRAIRNLTSLTTSGLTGDSMGGNDTLTTTGGGTRGLTGTTTTSTNFEDSEITRLRGLGMTNAQISAYLDNLNNLTASLDSTDTSGLSDFGLAAFRQAKAAGATDIEAMAAANLAISGLYPTTVETETGTELIVTSGRETGQETESETLERVIVTANGETETASEIESLPVITVTAFSEKETETETEVIPVVTITALSEKETETETEIIPVITITAFSETETESETITEVIVTTSSETETETETESIPVITITAFSETETETDTITESIVTTFSETETETDTITEIIITATLTESETETETETITKIVTKIVTTPVVTKPPTITAGSFPAGPTAQGGRGKPTEFLKEQLLKTYMTKDSFKDPLAQFNKARQELAKDEMMQQGVDPRLAAILAAKMNGEEAPPKKTYNYGEEPDSIDDILGLRVEGDRQYAQGGYVQPLMAQGGMTLPLMSAKGGLSAMHKGREDFRDGKHVAGEGDGQSDDIPAMLADGEFVFPADVVSALGNGSTKAGTDKLYEMMHSIRDRARSKGRKDLPPPALKSPLDYLKKR